MSSILFNLGEYKHFEEKSDLLKHLYNSSRPYTQQDLPASVGEFLFELNAEAYAERYAENAETGSEIEEARANLSFDPSDYDFGKVTDWNNLLQIYDLLKRIRYQCDEFHEGHPAMDRYEILQLMITILSQVLINKMKAGSEFNDIPAKYYTFSAATDKETLF